MTVSLPVTLPVPTTPGKSGTAPAKGLATAPGQNKKLDAGAQEVADVADMFAALVATLTAQMQPAEQTAASDGTATEGTVDGISAPVIPLLPEGVTAEVVAPATEGDIAAATDAAAEATAVPVGDEAELAAPAEPGAEIEAPAAIDGGDVDGKDTKGQGDVDGKDTKGQGDVDGKDTKGQGDEHRATPATPATPGEGGERAERATPAQPAQRAPTQATAAAVTPPVAGPAAAALVADKPEPDKGLTAVNAAPATPATPATAATERVTPATPAQPAPAPDAHVQVARIVRPLRLGNDGAYELALDLTPAELGRVRIDVELRGATIHLSLRADNPATRELLQASMDQLRSELEAAGLNAGSLDVGGSGAQGRGNANRNDDSATPAGSAVGDDTLVTEAPIEAGGQITPTNADGSGLSVLA